MCRTKSLCQTDLSYRAKLVYLYLYNRIDGEGKTWPSMKTIAEELSISRSTVKRAIKDLEEAGFIKKVHHYRENGGNTSNRYYLLFIQDDCKGASTPTM